MNGNGEWLQYFAPEGQSPSENNEMEVEDGSIFCAGRSIPPKWFRIVHESDNHPSENNEMEMENGCIMLHWKIHPSHYFAPL